MNLSASDILSNPKTNALARAALVRQFADTAEGPAKKRRGKYNAKRTQVRHCWFDSAGEAKAFGRVELMHRVGEVAWYVLQPQFVLPACIYKADFLLVMRGGAVRVIDFKGMDTKLSRLKRKQVQEIYGVSVELWK
jgi:hypothetical protein